MAKPLICPKCKKEVQTVVIKYESQTFTWNGSYYEDDGGNLPDQPDGPMCDDCDTDLNEFLERSPEGYDINGEENKQ